MDNKIDTIEEIITHQEQKIQDLSEMVSRQWKEIDGLKARLSQLLDKVVQIEEQGPGATEADRTLSVTEIAARDKPPHY